MLKALVRYGKHKRNCIAVRHVKRKFWHSAWVCPEIRMNWRRPSSSGFIFRCNDPDCNARIKISLGSIELQHAKIFLRIGTFWNCPKSPFGLCVYKHFEDRAHDDCIFCHDPEERK